MGSSVLREVIGSTRGWLTVGLLVYCTTIELEALPAVAVTVRIPPAGGADPGALVNLFK